MTTRTALLAHGLAGSGDGWWHLRGVLEAAGWAVSTPDARGHGAHAATTGAPPATFRLTDLADDLAALSPAPEVPWDLVVGHSLGGATAALAASRTPGWTRRLALLDPALVIDEQSMPAVRAEELADARDSTASSLARDRPQWDPRDRAAKLAAFEQLGPDTIERTFDDNPVWDVRDDLSRVDLPVLVLAGDPSVYTMIGTGLIAPVLAANPRVRYSPVLGTGHSPHRDRPDETASMVLRWADAATTA